MATLIQPLVTGFSDAALGSVEFYRHGTSTLSSQVYSDPDGQVAVSTHALDASGRVVRYVTERVDMVVKNASSTTVISVEDVASVDGRTVRLESNLFTGSNPNGNGQTIAGGVTTLHSGLSLFQTSFGTDDGLVLPSAQIDSTEYTLKSLLGFVARDARTTSTALGATTTYTPVAEYGIHAVSITGASLAFANPTYTSAPRAGAPLIIMFSNLAGANRTPTWGTAYSGIPATAVANNNTAVYVFVYTGTIAAAAPGEWVSVTGDPIEAAA